MKKPFMQRKNISDIRSILLGVFLEKGHAPGAWPHMGSRRKGERLYDDLHQRKPALYLRLDLLLKTLLVVRVLEK
jgi:hypothetical protein